MYFITPQSKKAQWTPTCLRWVGLLLVLLVSYSSFAQKQPSDKKNPKKEGELFFSTRNYSAAVPFFLEQQSKDPKDFEVKYKIGVCYFFMDSTDRAVSYLKYALNDKTVPDDSYLYLAKCYQRKKNYDFAGQYFKLYLATLDENAPEKSTVKHQILQTRNAIKYSATRLYDIIGNMGEYVNTIGDERRPIISPKDENTIYFTAARAGNVGKTNCPPQAGLAGECYTSDIFKTRLINGEWTLVEPAKPGYNTPFEDVLMDINSTQNQVFFWQGKDRNVGSVYADTFAWDTFFTAPTPLPNPFNTMPGGEGDICLFGDSVVIFSSERPGGYGGKDLWFSRLDRKKNWLAPVNLGENVNSPHNEIAPWLAKDGRTLYFSSDNIQSGGGYDIFKSRFIDSLTAWTLPKNLGFPVNSVDNDIDYRLMPDGLGGYFSSDRTGGYGGYDLFIHYIRGESLTDQIPAPKDMEASFDKIIQPPFVEIIAPLPEADLPPVNIDTTGLVIPDSFPTNPTSITPDKKEPKEFKDKPAPEKTIPILADKKDEAPVPITERYTFDPVYYNKSDGVLNTTSYATVNQLSRLCINHPDATIILMAHTDSTDHPVRDYYIAVKQAESLAKTLVDQGANKDKIIFRGYGSAYPQMKYLNPKKEKEPLAKTYNCRVEALIQFSPSTKGVAVDYRYPDIQAELKNNGVDGFRKNLGGLFYSIQLASLQKMYENEILLELSDVFTEGSFSMTSTRYCAGVFRDYQYAKKTLKDLSEKGFDNARIFVYNKGVRLTLGEVRELAKTNPELNNYLKDKDEE